jgi:hypothetical protein
MSQSFCVCHKCANLFDVAEIGVSDLCPECLGTHKVKMLCWAVYSDAHGFVMYNPLWLPEGEFPENEAKYERIPQFDFERDTTKVQRLEINRSQNYAVSVDSNI